MSTAAISSGYATHAEAREAAAAMLAKKNFSVAFRVEPGDVFSGADGWRRFDDLREGDNGCPLEPLEVRWPIFIDGRMYWAEYATQWVVVVGNMWIRRSGSTALGGTMPVTPNLLRFGECKTAFWRVAP